MRLLKSLRDSLSKGMTLIGIVVQNEEDAYTIFETLNDRGLRLSVPDLVLNLLMRQAPDDTSRQLVRHHWNAMLQQMGRRDVSRFLRHMWVSRYGDLKSEGLFSAIKRYINNSKLQSIDGTARRAYRQFVDNGIEQGKRTDLTGGGLVRSMGGWSAVKALRASRVFEKGDERILGNGDFLEKVLKSAEERMKNKYDLQARGFELTDVVARVVHVLEIEEERIWAAGIHREIVQARSLLCYWAVRELGVTMVSLARRLDQSVTAVGKAVIRGEKLAKINNFSLLEK